MGSKRLQRQIWPMRVTWLQLNLKVGKEAKANKCGQSRSWEWPQPIQSGSHSFHYKDELQLNSPYNRKNPINRMSSEGSRKEHSSPGTYIVQQRYPHNISSIENCKTTNFCCFKPLNFVNLLQQKQKTIYMSTIFTVCIAKLIQNNFSGLELWLNG